MVKYPAYLLPTISAETVHVYHTCDISTQAINTGVHVILAKACVKHMAMLYQQDATGEHNVTGRACYNVWTSHYTESIYDDIEQAITYELILLDKECLLDSKDGHMVFLDYHNKKGERRNAYGKLYKALYHCLGEYSLNSHQDGEIVLTDLVKTDDNGEDKVIDKKSSVFRQESACQYDGGLSDIAMRQDIRIFFKNLKRVKTAERFSKLCNIFQGMVEGLSYPEIAAKYDYSIAAVNRGVKDIRDAWKEYYGHVSISHTFHATWGHGVDGIITTMQAACEKKEGMRISTPESIKNFRAECAKNRIFYQYNVPVSILQKDTTRKLYDKSLQEYTTMKAWGLIQEGDNNKRKSVPHVRPWMTVGSKKDNTQGLMFPDIESWTYYQDNILQQPY